MYRERLFFGVSVSALGGRVSSGSLGTTHTVAPIGISGSLTYSADIADFYIK